MTAGPDIAHRFNLRQRALRVWQRWGPAFVAGVGAAILAVLGWHGKDFAASTYRVNEFRHHGPVLWDTAWYGGNYPLSYSVLFPPIGALLGLALTGVATAATCAGLFDRLVVGAWGRRSAGSWFFAVTTLLEVGIGQFPYLTGEAFGLLALFAVSRRRVAPAVVAGVAAALCSGVAAAFLAVAAIGWAYAATSQRGALIAVALVPIAVLGAVNVAFPGTGSFPYPVGGFLLSLAVGALALSPLGRAAPAVRAGALLFAALAIGAFVIPSPMGGNASRFAQSLGIPLLVCLVVSPIAAAPRLSAGWHWPRGIATRWPWVEVSRWPWGKNSRVWRSATAVALVPLVIWQWGPGKNVIESVSRGPATTAGFYQPLIAALATRTPDPVRVEVVPTEQHWESVYVAPHVALARGWERQIDIAHNPLFYESGALQVDVYRRWLLSNGVSFVALPNAPLDYAGQAEGSLLTTGARAAGLSEVWRTPNWQLWRVDGTPGLLSGPGRVTALGPDAVSVAASSAGTLTLRVRWTRYWSIASAGSCIQAGPDGTTTIRTSRAEVLKLQTTFDPRGGSGHC